MKSSHPIFDATQTARREEERTMRRWSWRSARDWIDARKRKPHPRYKTNDLVIIETFDLYLGNVRVPAIVRYYDERCDAYEVNALIPPGEMCADQRDIRWWIVTENEIAACYGQMRTDKPAIMRRDATQPAHATARKGATPS